jgi:hypothetical protein
MPGNTVRLTCGIYSDFLLVWLVIVRSHYLNWRMNNIANNIIEKSQQNSVEVCVHSKNVDRELLNHR